MFLRGNLIKFKLVFEVYWKLCFFFNEEDDILFLELKFIVYDNLIRLSCFLWFYMCFKVVFLFFLNFIG